MSEATVVVQEAPPSEPVEAVAEASVEIAEIQAERDVAIAEIQAETTEAAIEAEAEANDEDVEWLRAELDGLRSSLAMHEAASSAHDGRITELETQIASLTETVTAQAAAILLLTPQSPLPEETPPVTESPAEAVGQRADREEGARQRKRVWLA